jgi:hypothetical protein
MSTLLQSAFSAVMDAIREAGLRLAVGAKDDFFPDDLSDQMLGPQRGTPDNKACHRFGLGDSCPCGWVTQSRPSRTKLVEPGCLHAVARR